MQILFNNENLIFVSRMNIPQFSQLAHLDMAFSLVRFVENDEIEEAVVPTNWMKGGKVYWSTSINAKRDCMNKIPLNQNWPAYDLVSIKISDGMYYILIDTFHLVHNNNLFYLIRTYHNHKILVTFFISFIFLQTTMIWWKGMLSLLQKMIVRLRKSLFYFTVGNFFFYNLLLF